jgi:hypothetical protein
MAVMKHNESVRKQLRCMDFQSATLNEKTSPGKIARLVFSSHLRYAWV